MNKTTKKYSVTFDSRSKSFIADRVHNFATLQMRQSICNDKLRVQGHLFLNEVLDVLYLPRVREGQIDGWVYFRKYKPDGYVDFGIGRMTFNTQEPIITLHLNVTENILDDVFGSEL